MVARIWRGYTTPEKADQYENLLKKEIFVGIEKMNIPGYQKIQLLKRDIGEEIEFTTIMWFDHLESVKSFVGQDYETAYVPDKARKILSHYDKKSIHCELVHSIVYE